MGKRAFYLLASALFLAGCGSAGTENGEGDYFGVSDEAHAAVVLDGELLPEEALARENGIYLPWEMVWKGIDSGFYFEEALGALYMTLPEESHRWTEDDGSGYLLMEDGDPYILTDCIAAYSDAEVKVFSEPARAVIVSSPGTSEKGTVREAVSLYSDPGGRGGILRELAQAEDVLVLSGEDGWSRVSSDDGYTGFAKSAAIEAKKTGTTVSSEGKFEKQDFNGTIRMIWDFIEFQDDHQYLETMLEAADGVNVISPTWYAVSDMSGNLSTLSEDSYVKRAHEMGMEVWPMLSDYSGEAGSTGEALRTREARRNIIDSMMFEADRCGFDGINVDFERIREEFAPDFIQFLRELCAEAHQRSLIVSVDNYVPTYTGYYNRTAQIEACDYIVVMAYDEHTASSSEPGSAASLPFVKQGIEDTIAEVPAERVVLGVPFYSRAWTETFGEEGFSTQALDMEGAENFIQEHGIDTDLYWDASLGQHYGTATDSRARYSIWQEDEDSLKVKLDLVAEYSLAGASAWRLGYERDTVWNTWTDCLGK